MKTKQKTIHIRDYGVIIGFILLCVVMSIASPVFLTGRNMLSILKQTAVIGVISAGMTVIIISGNFDISVGYICACAGAITALLIKSGINPILAILIALVFGATVGIISGIAVAKFAIPSMIATLGMGQIINGFMLFITGGYPISVTSPIMEIIGKSTFLRIPILIYFFILAIIVINFILKKTILGRHIYAVGGNEEASRVSGVSVKGVKVLAFVISSALAAFAGVMLTARVGTATVTMGSGYELKAIASVVIGGTCVSGGEGNAWKTIIGVLLMGVISNSFNLLGVEVFFQYILEGLIILLAVGFDSYGRKYGKR